MEAKSARNLPCLPVSPKSKLHNVQCELVFLKHLYLSFSCFVPPCGAHISSFFDVCVRVYVSAPPPPPSASASSAATVYKRISQWAQMRRTCRTGGRADGGAPLLGSVCVAYRARQNSGLMSISGNVSQGETGGRLLGNLGSKIIS